MNECIFEVPVIGTKLEILSNYHFFYIDESRTQTASTGFEAITPAMSVQYSINWAMRPHNWEQVNLLGSCVLVKRTKEWKTLTWSQLCGFISQLVEHCTSIAGSIGSKQSWVAPFEATRNFQAFIRDICLNCPLKCDDNFFAPIFCCQMKTTDKI